MKGENGVFSQREIVATCATKRSVFCETTGVETLFLIHAKYSTIYACLRRSMGKNLRETSYEKDSTNASCRGDSGD